MIDLLDYINFEQLVKDNNLVSEDIDLDDCLALEEILMKYVANNSLKDLDE